MGRGHRGAGDGVDAAVVPGGGDADTRGEDVDEGAVVAEGGAGVVDVGRADGARGGLRRGRVELRVVVGVAGCDGEEDARGDGSFNLEHARAC